jgi:hypothetical protein
VVILVAGGKPGFTSDTEEETEIPIGLEGEDFDTPRTGVVEIVCWGGGEGSVGVVKLLSVTFIGSV